MESRLQTEACRAPLLSWLSSESRCEWEIRWDEELSDDDSVRASLEVDCSRPGQQGAEGRGQTHAPASISSLATAASVSCVVAT